MIISITSNKRPLIIKIFLKELDYRCIPDQHYKDIIKCKES